MPKYQNTHIFARVEKTENYFARRADNAKGYVVAPSCVRSYHTKGMSSKDLYLASKREKEANESELANAFRL